MKLKSILQSLLVLTLGSAAFADLIGEQADYVLNRALDRTSWLIRGGNGKTLIKEYQPDAPLGPSYLVSLEYDIEVRFRGRQQGTVEFLIPEAVFTDQFYQDLVDHHPVDFGSFKVDFLGMGSFVDPHGNHYEQCYLTRIYDVDFARITNVDPLKDPFSMIPGKVTGILREFENFELRLAINRSVPVLGAVQIDLSGTAFGINITAGFDFTKNAMLF